MTSEQMAGLYILGMVVVTVFGLGWLVEQSWSALRRRQDALADVRWPGSWTVLPGRPAYSSSEGLPALRIHPPILERAGVPETTPAFKAAFGPFRPPRFEGDALAGLGECDCDGCRNLRLFKAGA